MKQITYSELIGRLEVSRGAMPVGIRATTDAKARKTGNPYGIISKVVRAVGFVGADYEIAVKNTGIKQGISETVNFVASKLPWGEWLIPCKVITHKGAYYLRTQTTSGMRNRQGAKVLAYFSESGEILSYRQVALFLPGASHSAKQENVGITNTDSQVWVRTYRFDSIQSLRFGGEAFELVPDNAKPVSRMSIGELKTAISKLRGELVAI